MKFSKDFVFGTATSSYQIEGAYNEGGRTDSIWDVFAKTPGKIVDHSNGDVACDHYHKYKDDVKLMKELGINSYRLSISWSRIIPEKGKLNHEGINFYRNLMLELKAAGIGVCATIYHWDLPQWIYEENKGWVHRDTVNYFVEYSKVLFEAYDDLVDLWITLNEPWCSAHLGYLMGYHAPGHANFNDYIRAHHHLLLAHGKAVELYRQMNLKKQIGITINTLHTYTPTNSFEDQIAYQSADGFRNRMFYDPLFKGQYPMDIILLISKHVKDFSFIEENDLKSISTPIDFLGINFYNRDYVNYNPNDELLTGYPSSDLKRTAMDWEVTPWALKDTVVRLRKEYTDIPVYITENGSAWYDELEDGKVHDVDRVDYLKQHLEVVSELNEMNMNVKGYYAWSLMDNYEWAWGYTRRFGIVYVDYETQKRYPKDSFYYYQQVIKNSK